MSVEVRFAVDLDDKVFTCPLRTDRAQNSALQRLIQRQRAMLQYLEGPRQCYGNGYGG